MNNLVFMVEQKDNVTIFTNNSNYDLWISLKPIKPKRKYIDVRVIPSKQNVIYDHLFFDLLSISFSLVDKYEVKNERS